MTKLLFTRSRIEGELIRQLSVGSALLGTVLSAVDDLRREREGVDQAFIRARSSYRTWNEYNRTLLQQAYDDRSVSAHYSNVTRLVRRRGDLDDELGTLSANVQEQIRVLQSLQSQMSLLEPDPANTQTPAGLKGANLKSGPVFIGHGRSPEWLKLRSFLKDRLHLDFAEYNSQAVAGMARKERLEQLLDQCSFAFLVLTAEDEHPDGTVHARENVIHEVGLFQGRLSFARAIVLLEDGCEEFSNIEGLEQLRFQKGNIKSAFEDIRSVLEREGILPVDAGGRRG